MKPKLRVSCVISDGAIGKFEAHRLNLLQVHFSVVELLLRHNDYILLGFVIRISRVNLKLENRLEQREGSAGRREAQLPSGLCRLLRKVTVKPTVGKKCADHVKDRSTTKSHEILRNVGRLANLSKIVEVASIGVIVLKLPVIIQHELQPAVLVPAASSYCY